jgi:hypothetical protein
LYLLGFDCLLCDKGDKRQLKIVLGIQELVWGDSCEGGLSDELDTKVLVA